MGAIMKIEDLIEEEVTYSAECSNCPTIHNGYDRKNDLIKAIEKLGWQAIDNCLLCESCAEEILADADQD